MSALLERDHVELREGVDGRRDPTRMFAAYRRTGDRRIADALVRHYLPLTERLAARYRHAPTPQDDLEQVGALALVQAIQRFDPSRGVPFEAYAIPTIQGALKRHFRDTTWMVRVPRSSQELMLRVKEGIDRLTPRVGRSPTVAELASFLRLDEEDVLEGLHAHEIHESDSLDQPRREVDQEGDTLGDTMGELDTGFALACDRADLHRAMATLSERDQELLRLRFAEDLTQTEIAERIGCSQMHVSRLLRKAITRLRAVMEPAGARELTGGHGSSQVATAG
jgi:RNA polymerase sigma-B factor